MEKHFLDDFVKEQGSNGTEPLASSVRAPWYNPYGDCVMYQTVDEATVADRIDEYLTILRSAVDDRPIGFQLKDVLAVIKRYGCEALRVSAAIHKDQVISVKALLLAAYELRPPTVHRRRAYASVPAPDIDAVAIPEAA